MKKKLKLILKIVVVLIILGIIAGIFVVGKMVNDGVLYQNRGNDTKANGIKQLEIWEFDVEGFYAKHTGIEFKIQSEDGNTIPGSIFMDENNTKWVIFVHGAGGSHEFGISYVEDYIENGYNVLTFDERGHGDNSDERVTFGINEKNDVKALVDYVKNEYAAEFVIVHGQSMGGATAALYAATEHAKENIDACVLDSPVPGLELFLRLMFTEDGTSENVANAIIGCGKIYSGIFSGLDYSEGDTIEKAKEIMVPTMVIVSKQDTVCLPEYVEDIYANIAAENKKMVEFDCQHIKGVFDYREQYFNEIFDFLNNLNQ